MSLCTLLMKIIVFNAPMSMNDAFFYNKKKLKHEYYYMHFRLCTKNARCTSDAIVPLETSNNRDNDGNKSWTFRFIPDKANTNVDLSMLLCLLSIKSTLSCILCMKDAP